MTSCQSKTHSTGTAVTGDNWTLTTMNEPHTYDGPEHGWTCFHCGATFLSPAGAREHFGNDPSATAACLMGGERGLVRKLRWRERQVSKLESRLCTGSCLSRGCNCQSR
jgi:hypothetical protein